MRRTRMLAVAFALMLPAAVILAVIAFTNRGATQEASRVRQLQPLTFAQLQSLPGGDAVLIEGRISPRASAQLRSLVTYVAEERRIDNDLTSVVYHELDRFTPPLVIDLPDGEVPLINSTYDIRNPSASWLNTVEGAIVRYSGFEVGSPVVVIGTLIRTNDGIKIAADVVSGGTRADYLAAQGGAAALPALAGILAVALAVFGLALAYLTLRRTRTAPAQ